VAEGAENAAKVREYLAALSPDPRRILKRIRASIRAAMPDAVEHFSYGIPGFRLNDEPLIWYAAWRDHISLHPIGPGIVAEHAKALRGLETSKGTVRFPFERPPSDALLKKLLRSRVKLIRAAPSRRTTAPSTARRSGKG
jgi:uncharacterized protein YdhG (YjbR/CyaY superfamily)